MVWRTAFGRVAGGLRARVLLCVVLAVVCCFVSAALGVGCAGAREFGGEGNAAGQLGEDGGVAAGGGDLFELESASNRRVNGFTQAGEFLRAFGWGVVDGAEMLEVCTSTCRAGLQGAGAGELADGASGVAVSQSSGNVFVADQSNSRVEEFTAMGGFVVAFGREVDLTKVTERQQEELLIGEPVTVTPREEREEDVCNGSASEACQAGSIGSGPAAFEFAQRQLADRSSPITVGVNSASPIVYVGSNGRVEMFEEDGSYLGASPVEIEKSGTKEALGRVEAIAASTGRPAPDVYVIAAGDEHVVEYEEAKANELQVLHELPGPDVLHEFANVGPEPEAITYDATSETLLVENEGHSANRRILVYNAAGEHIQTFPTYTGQTEGTHSIAWGESTEEVYLTTGFPRKIRSLPVPPVGPLVTADVAEPGPEGGVRLAATVDPEGAETTVSFEYESAPGVFSVLLSQKIAGEVGGEPNFNEETIDENGVPLEVTTHLTPATTYNYRVRTANSNGVTGVGFTEPLGSFTTLPAAQITGLSATNVSATGMSVAASVNPLDEASSWWVEYAAAGSSEYKSTAVEQLPGVDEDLQVATHITGLSPDTSYRVRLAVENSLAEEPEPGAVRSSEIVVVTQQAGTATGLPDGRQWEMVSPPAKGNASFEGITGEGGLIQAAENGDAISYLATAATGAGAEGEPSPEYAQVLSTHNTGGWSTRDIASRHEQGWFAEPGHFAEFLAFSSDLTAGIVEPQGQTLFGDATERTPYLRTQALCETGASSCYQPLITTSDVTSGDAWGGSPTNVTGDVKYDAATSDLLHVVLRSTVPLLAGAKGTGLYEWNAGHLLLISVSECHSPVCSEAECPVLSGNSKRGVISADGDRVIWRNAACEGDHLYMYEGGRGESIQLDVGGASGDSAVFQAASVDGSRVFFSDGEALTSDSRADAADPDLYVFEANPDTSSEPGVLRDLTVPVNATESADVMGLIPGISEDGSIAYVVAGGILSTAANAYGDLPQSGQPNLYRIVRSESGGKAVWTPTFITTLSNQDQSDWGGSDGETAQLTSYLSGDGRWLAFMSDRSLTGYDNRDAVSGQADEEVFLYDESTGRLVCASCNPRGARPRSREGGSMLSGWSTSSLSVGAHAPRYVSDSGRLFFNSSDGLVSGDVDGTWDVYEYEPPGVGSCSTSSAAYSASQFGCIGLISGGDSAEGSVFLDASANGNDVFFLTAAKLSSRDDDESYDVYDAHVCGSGWECESAGAGGAAGVCESAASCKASTGGGEGVTSPPASSSFEGTGNLTAKKAAGKPASKASSNAAKLKSAVARCRRVDRRHARKRHQCEAAAHRKYGPAASSHHKPGSHKTKKRSGVVGVGGR